MPVGAETTRRVSTYLPQADQIARSEYGENPPVVDVKCISRQDFHEQVIHSCNRIGAVAYREGIVMDGFLPSATELDATIPNPENLDRGPRARVSTQP